VNHMNAPNLAICLAPILVTSTGSASFIGTMESMGRAQGLVRDLILQYEWIFEKDEEIIEEEEEAADEITAKEELPGAGSPEESSEVQPGESS